MISTKIDSILIQTHVKKVIFPDVVKLLAAAKLRKLHLSFVDLRAEHPTTFRGKVFITLLVH